MVTTAATLKERELWESQSKLWSPGWTDMELKTLPKLELFRNSVIQIVEKILTKELAIREPFKDGPRNFEPRSDDEDDAWAGTPSPNFRAAPAGGCLATTHDLGCSRPHTKRIFSEIGFRTCGPPVPRSRPYH
ncbi:hypothetical protein AVEN_273031-1 [Araneus ventricosus]|uniref:Uncharacterized protein n=1 Tax=Araneus ventricosus TaxID=182803 RepID=A0A4Y2H6B1_ARAVE|nr:hypothetical protein AVEN_273031-1 [Araneus ventricosus]